MTSPRSSCSATVRSVGFALLALGLILPSSGVAQQLTGVVVDAENGDGVANALLAFLPVGEDEPLARVETDAEGIFRALPLPAGRYLLFVEALGYEALDSVAVELPRAEPLRLALTPRPLEVEGVDAVAVDDRFLRPAAITGRVLRAGDDEPLPGRAVAVGDLGGSPIARDRSDDTGRYGATVPSAGLYGLTVEGARNRVEVAVPPGEDLYLELRLDAEGRLSVSAPHDLPWLEASGFFARRRTEDGDFYEAEDLEEHRSPVPSQVFRRLEGLRPQGRRGLAFEDVTHWGRPCTPTFVVDFQRMSREEVDRLVLRSRIRGVEVYAGAHDVPQRWKDPDVCGLVVIWTSR